MINRRNPLKADRIGLLIKTGGLCRILRLRSPDFVTVLSDPVASFSGMEVLEALIANRRRANVCDAEELALLAQLAEANEGDDREFIVIDIARALHIADATASVRLHEAQTLMLVPRVFAAGRSGDLSRTKLSIVASAVRALTGRVAPSAVPELLQRFEAAVLPRAISETPGELRRRVQKIIARLAPETLAEAERDAAARRGVTAWAESAQAFLEFRLTADGAETVMTAVDAHAAKRPDVDGQSDERTVDQRRADALVEICNRALHGSDCTELPMQQGRRPAVNVTVSLSALLGADGPGELAGFGPISADLARELAFDPTARWTGCVVDAEGRLIHRGSTSYRPPTAMREYVLTRDGVCAMPGCLRTARRCDLDHVHDWHLGGLTDADNLQPLCRRHHHAKHDAGWQPERLEDGSTEWLSPTGRVYRKPATTLPIDTTAHDLDPPPF